MFRSRCEVIPEGSGGLLIERHLSIVDGVPLEARFGCALGDNARCRGEGSGRVNEVRVVPIE